MPAIALSLTFRLKACFAVRRRARATQTSCRPSLGSMLEHKLLDLTRHATPQLITYHTSARQRPRRSAAAVVAVTALQVGALTHVRLQISVYGHAAVPGWAWLAALKLSWHCQTYWPKICWLQGLQAACHHSCRLAMPLLAGCQLVAYPVSSARSSLPHLASFRLCATGLVSHLSFRVPSAWLAGWSRSLPC